jgi:cell division protease FtsH
MIERIMNKYNESSIQHLPTPTIVIRRAIFKETQSEKDDDSENYDMFGNPYSRPSTEKKKKKKSENFEIASDSSLSFKDVGGYDKIKTELYQCMDILSNYSKYAPFNVRVPKGLILEGPPGNGKTLLAKAFSGEANASFIAVSGSEFQEKYVGVGPSRIRELFQLARQNVPCVIFIDEIDALGRKRSSDGELSSTERDSTLNELLVALDGFKNTSGVFLIGATNRADLLDPALLRPGRVDKRVFIGNPDAITRRAILSIHSKGKPHDTSIILAEMVEQTNGLSGAQIENLLNEAMLHALRDNRWVFTSTDIDTVMNKIMAGWQPNEHTFTTDLVHQIAIHELGHAVVSLYCKHHSKMSKIIINLSSPKSPAYTVFENSANTIVTQESLFEHLVILLSGRIAEEVFFGISVTTGAVHDFEEAMKLAHSMICYYGMGEKLIYPNTSEKYKEMIDDEIAWLIEKAYFHGYHIIDNAKSLIEEGAKLLKENKQVTYDGLFDLSKKYTIMDDE